MKKGFTLVEVMVVIVILGILASIGVPKLFGSIAKAKASEIPIASSNYVTLQDVYLGEKTVLGSWKDIGYIPPGNGSSNNFTYSGDCFDGTSVSQIQQNALGWKAVSATTLNDCPNGSAWATTLTAAAQNSVTYKHLTDEVNCIALVSNWGFGRIVSDCSPAKTEASEEPEASEGGIVSAGQATSTNEEQAAQPGTLEAAKSAVAAAKSAFTMCNNKCANHKELKAAWDNAKASCEGTYGKGACN